MFRQDLAHLSFFKDFTEAQYDLLESIAEPCHLAAGQVVFEQGQPADNLYVLLEGSVNVDYKPYDGPPMTVTRISVGGVFGWSAVLAREAYTSSALAVSNGQALRIAGCRLRSAFETQPENAEVLLESLSRVVNERLRATHEQILAIINQGIEDASQC